MWRNVSEISYPVFGAAGALRGSKPSGGNRLDFASPAVYRARRAFRSIAPLWLFAAVLPIYRRFRYDPAPYLAEIRAPARTFDSPPAEPRVWPESPESTYQRGDEFHELALKYKPSKRFHAYIRHYSRHFAPIRSDVRLMIEIGVQTPNSLQMWEAYFPNATIVGIDIDPACKAFENGRKLVRIGDQNDKAFLDSIVDEFGGKIDIIIDDGEHSQPAILTSFCRLFPALAPHGIYAVEDLIDMPRLAEFFHQIERSINHWPVEAKTTDWQYLWRFENASWLDRNVTGLHFYRHVCFVERGHNPEDNPYLRPKA
jgi:hypothetical protein